MHTLSFTCNISIVLLVSGKKMNNVDKISKETLAVLEYSKEIVKTNLVKANSLGQIEPQLTNEQLQKVSNLLDTFFSQGLQIALPNFQKVVSGIIPSTFAKKK